MNRKSSRNKDEVITFKVDAGLSKALKGVPNRSAFIRNAVQNALKGCCPLCGGTGTLTAAQLRHWNDFAERHSVAECGDCHARHLVCSNSEGAIHV